MPFSLLAHQSTILPLATAGLLGAGMARLSYILMDVLDDDSSEARTDQRIRLLDRVMRLKAKPGVVVVEASDADVDGGLYRPEDWRSEQIQDYAARTCQTACLAADCQTAWAPSGRGPGGLRDGAALQAGAARAGGLRGAADEGRRHVEAAGGPDAVPTPPTRRACATSAATGPWTRCLLPCGHSGACYACAVETSRARSCCPCCRGAVDQIVVYDPASRKDEDETPCSASWARAPSSGRRAGRRALENGRDGRRRRPSRRRAPGLNTPRE